MRITGFLLFIVGIVGALISAAKLPVAGGAWSDILYFYVEAIAVALVGLLLLHWPKTLSENLVSHIDSSHVMDLLPDLVAEMQNLRPSIKELDCVEIATQVKNLLNTYVLPFAARRQDIILALGQAQSVDVLLTAAQGERLLNRIWSAASDGHKFEIIVTYPKALAAFKTACKISKNCVDDE